MNCIVTQNQVRISVRELEETVWRAFRAVGVSNGEALTAARSVCFTEIHLGTGLQSVPSEVAMAASGSNSSELVPGAVDRLVSPGIQGLLLAGPLAIGLVATRPSGSAVVLPAVKFSPVAAGLLANCIGPNGPKLMAFEIDEFADPTQGVMARSDRSIAFVEKQTIESWLHEQPDLLPTVLASSPHGAMLFTSELTRVGMPSDPSESASVLSICSPKDTANGVLVDASIWKAVYSVAVRYLVAD